MKHAFFIVPLIVFALSFSAYYFFSCPGLFWEDSSLMDAVARTLSITHSPGHPAYSLMSRFIVILLNPFVSQSRAVVIASAFYSSLSLFFFSYALIRMGRSLIMSVISPLLFGFSAPVFHYSTVSETYCLLVAGLSLFPLAFSKKRDFALYSYFLGFLSGGSILLAVVYPVAVLFFYLKEKNLRFVFSTAPLFILGLSVYFFLFFRGQASPPVNWGAPGKFGNFLDMLAMKEFRGDFFSGFLSQSNPVQSLFQLFKSIVLNYSVIGSILFVPSFIALYRKHGPLSLCVPVIFLFYLVFSLKAGRGPDFEAYTIPLYFFAAFTASFAPIEGKYGKLSLAILISSVFVSFFLNHPHMLRRHSEGARLYADHLAEEIPQNSVVFCENTNEYFLLLDMQAAEGRRTDLTLVYPDLLDERWYQSSLGKLFFFLKKPEDLKNYCLQNSMPLVLIPSSKTKSFPAYFTPKNSYFLFNGNDTFSQTAQRIIFDPEPYSQNHQRVLWENQMHYFYSNGKISDLLTVLDSLNENFDFWQYRFNRAQVRLDLYKTEVSPQQSQLIMEDLENALKLGAEKNMVFFNFSRVFASQGKFSEALSYASKMNESPEKSEITVLIHLSAGDLESAKTELREALLKWPGDIKLRDLKMLIGE
ncbi:DUF2723 domain-containing protein [candidate division WOR-3 bacterium]|nr:DUF2723 domain-containing protein [candidate division WOR-3 bacterium]